MRREVRNTDFEKSDFKREMDDAPKVCTGCGQDFDKTVQYECHLDDVQSEEQAGFPASQYDDDKSVLCLTNFQIIPQPTTIPPSRVALTAFLCIPLLLC